MITRLLNVSIITTLFILFTGCSRGNPTLPEYSTCDLSGNFNPLITVTDFDSKGNPIEGSGALGAFQIKINLDNLTGELIPIRKTSSKDVLEIVDITNFLTLAPCTDCVNLRSIQLNSDENLVLSIGVKHPFNAPDPSAPITGRNRADLHVFNIEGTVIFGDDATSVIDFPGIASKIAPITLVNADGYSPYLDSSIDSIMPTEATLHPYILHFDDFSYGNFDATSVNGFSDILNPTGNLVMAMGSPMDYQDYVFNLGESPRNIDFILAIGCTYGISSENKNQRLNPVYHLPQFNKKAASCTWVSEIIEDNGLGLEPGDPSSTETIILNVLDMNHGFIVGENLNEMRFQSDIGSISVEIPSIISNAINYTSPTPTGGSPRDPLNPLSYALTISNELGAPIGTYPGLIKVLDTYVPDLNEMVAGDGISRVNPTQIPTDGLFQITEFATYAAFTVEVEFHNHAPDACFEYLPLGDIQTDLPVKFDASCSTDTDGDNLIYEWDFDYNMSNFQTEATGYLINHPFTLAKTYTVALRVTDDGLPQMPDITTQEIIINPLQDLTFGPNISIMGPVLATGYPIGMHYADSEGSKIYAAVTKQITPPPNLTQNVLAVRSDDGGSSFVLPAYQVNDVSGIIPTASLCLTPSGKADVAWIIPGMTSSICGHDRDDGAYSFGTDDMVYNLSWFANNSSHDLYGDNEIYVSYSHLSSGLFRAVLFKSNDAGETFTGPIDIAEKAGAGTAGNYHTCEVVTDDEGAIHVVFIAGNLTSEPKEIRYTKSTDDGLTFTTYVPLFILPGLSNAQLISYMSVSLDTSPDGENVYIAYRSRSGGIRNIYLMKSSDGGSSFDPAVTVDDCATNCDLPCIVVDDYGWIYVSYEDRFDETAPVHYDVRVSRSHDGGASFEASVLVNDDLTGENQVAPSITVDDDLNVHVFWKDDRENPDTSFNLYYAKGK